MGEVQKCILMCLCAIRETHRSRYCVTGGRVCECLLMHVAHAGCVESEPRNDDDDDDDDVQKHKADVADPGPNASGCNAL